MTEQIYTLVASSNTYGRYALDEPGELTKEQWEVILEAINYYSSRPGIREEVIDECDKITSIIIRMRRKVKKKPSK